jgi:hypothetical protein
MKRLFTHSLFLAVAAQSFTVLCAEPQKQFPLVRGGLQYNRIHGATTTLSYAGALVLTTASEFMGALMAFGGENPWMAIALKYGGLAAGAGLVCATPYLTNQFLHKQNYLSKKDATYTRNQLLAHGAARLFVFGLLYLYGNAGINATKDLLFTLRNG